MQSTNIRQAMGDNYMGQIFDTLKYTKRAMAAGIPQDAAEFHAEELATVINDSLVTKDYLQQELAALENRLIWKLMGVIGFMLTVSQVVGHFFK